MSTKALTAMTPSAVKELAASLQFESEPDIIFQNVSNKLLDAPDEHEALRAFYPEATTLMRAAGVGSQYSIADAVRHEYSPLVVSFSRQLIEEYRCKTPSEIALAEVTASSYVQYIDFSKRMGIHINNPFYYKAVDRAHRQFISALGALRHMKAPPMQVNVVKAQTAFVAQNQVNAITKEPNDTHDIK